MDPDDVWCYQNLRLSICEGAGVPVWRCVGRTRRRRRGGACGCDVRNVLDFGLREVSFPLRTSELFWTPVDQTPEDCRSKLHFSEKSRNFVTSLLKEVTAYNHILEI